VVCVGWQEAAAFAQWLSKQTGKHYGCRVRRVRPRRAQGFGRRVQGQSRDAAYKHQFDSRQGSDCDRRLCATRRSAASPRSMAFMISTECARMVGACGGERARKPAAAAAISWLRARLAVAVEGSNHRQRHLCLPMCGLNSVGFRVVRELEKVKMEVYIFANVATGTTMMPRGKLKSQSRHFFFIQRFPK